MGPAHGQVVTLPGRRWVWGRKKLGQNPFPMRGPPEQRHWEPLSVSEGSSWGDL